jgi:hypothetical protein
VHCVESIVYRIMKFEGQLVWNAIAISQKERQQSWDLRLRPVHDHGIVKLSEWSLTSGVIGLLTGL